MRFPYLARSTRRPVYPLAGATTRHLPVFAITLSQGGRRHTIDGLLDSGSSDTIVPLWLASLLGIDLSHAPTGSSQQAGGAPLLYRYAPVRLRISDGQETCQWDAIVGFLDIPGKPRATLGHAGFLQFFDITLYGARHELEIIPNTAFSGSHTVH